MVVESAVGARVGRLLALGAALVLVAGGCAFVRRVTTDQVTGGSLGTTGRGAVSSDGRYIAFPSLGQVFIRDTLANTTEMMSVALNGEEEPDGEADNPAISADGRYVAFDSWSSNLVADDTNDQTDVFVRDRVTGVTQRVSISSDGEEAESSSYQPSISANGGRVAFTSESDILDPIDSNGSPDAYVRDRSTNKTVLVSLSNAGEQADYGAWDASISGGGTRVSFTTDSPLVLNDENDSEDVYVRDMNGAKTIRASGPRVADNFGGGGNGASLNSNGTVVVFESYAPDLVAGDTNGTSDVFVRNLSTNVTTLVSKTTAGGPVTGLSLQGAVSANGLRVSYVSAGNPTGADTNGSAYDVFVHDLTTGRTALTSTDQLLGQTSALSVLPTLSGDGRYSVWGSNGSYSPNVPDNGFNLFIRAVDVPAVSAVAPTSLPRGTATTVTITGAWFLPGAQVIGPSGMTVGTATVNSVSSITVALTPGAAMPLGPIDLYVQNLGTGPGIMTGALGRCTGCLTIR